MVCRLYYGALRAETVLQAVLPRSNPASLFSDTLSSASLRVRFCRLTSDVSVQAYLCVDPIFQATQDLAFNEKVIAGAESYVKAYEDELLKLKDIGADTGFWTSAMGTSTVSRRARYLLDKIRSYQTKIENLEKTNAGLKRVLAQVVGR